MVYEYGVENKQFVQCFLSSLVPQEEIDSLRRVEKVYIQNKLMVPAANLEQLSRIENNAVDCREVRFPAEGRWLSLTTDHVEKNINELRGVLKLWSEKWDNLSWENWTLEDQNAFVTAFEKSMSECFPIRSYFNREEFENEFELKWIPSEASMVSPENIKNRDNPTAVKLTEEMLSQISGRVDKLCGEITATNEKLDQFIRKTNEGLVSAEKRFDYLKTTLDDLPQMFWKKRTAIDRW